MSLDDKRAWLNRGKKAASELERLKEVHATLYNAATRTTSNTTAAKVSGSRKMHSYDGLAIIDNMISQKEQELKKIQNQCLTLLCSELDGLALQLFVCRYIELKSVSETAEIIKYSESHLKHVHRIALEKLEIPVDMIN